MLMIIAYRYVFYGVMKNYDSDIAYVSYQQGITLNKVIAQLLLQCGPPFHTNSTTKICSVRHSPDGRSKSNTACLAAWRN